MAQLLPRIMMDLIRTEKCFFLCKVLSSLHSTYYALPPFSLSCLLSECFGIEIENEGALIDKKISWSKEKIWKKKKELWRRKERKTERKKKKKKHYAKKRRNKERKKKERNLDCLQSNPSIKIERLLFEKRCKKFCFNQKI